MTATAPAAPAGPWWACFAALCLVLLAPLLLTDVPPLLDYPNHLARLVVLAANGSDPILARFYQPDWDIIPDVAIDVITPPLLWFLPVHVAGRIMVGIVLLLTVFGTIAYSRAALGQRTWWSLGCVLVAYNATFLEGFLNFGVGIAGALLLSAAWLRWRETHPVRTFLIAIPGSVVLFFCHLMGLLFAILLIGTYELTRLPALRRQPAAVAKRLLFAASVAVLPAVLYAMSDLAVTGGDAEYPTLVSKIAELVVPFVNYSWPLDLATAILVLGAVAAGALVQRIRIPLSTAIAGLLLVIFYAMSPSAIKGTYNLDSRFVVLFGFLLFGGVRWVGLPLRVEQGIASAAIALFAVRMALLCNVWLAHNTDLAQLRTVMESVAPGSRVFVTTITPAEEPEYWARGTAARRLSNDVRTDPHLPALLLIEHRAWWPFLFDNPSQQPIVTQPAYRALADRVGSMPPHHDLEVPGKVDLCGFDNVLLLQAGAERDLSHYAADRLILVAAEDAGALFRIRPDPSCPPQKF